MPIQLGNALRLTRKLKITNADIATYFADVALLPCTYFAHSSIDLSVYPLNALLGATSTRRTCQYIISIKCS